MNCFFPHHFSVSVIVHIAADLNRVADCSLNCTACHTKEKISICTECFLIYEVSPAADTLTNEETENGNIQHWKYFDFSYFTYYIADYESADDSTIDSKSAVTGIDYGLECFTDRAFVVVFPFHRHVI